MCSRIWLTKHVQIFSRYAVAVMNENDQHINHHFKSQSKSCLSEHVKWDYVANLDNATELDTLSSWMLPGLHPLGDSTRRHEESVAAQSPNKLLDTTNEHLYSKTTTGKYQGGTKFCWADCLNCIHVIEYLESKFSRPPRTS